MKELVEIFLPSILELPITGVARILVWRGPPGQRDPAMHQWFTRLKLSRAAGDGPVSAPAVSRVMMEPQSGINNNTINIDEMAFGGGFL